MKSRLRCALALVGSLALVVSACGDDDDASTDATDGTTAPAEGSAPATEGGGDGEEVTLSLQVGDDATAVAQAEGLTAAFTELRGDPFASTNSRVSSASVR